MRLIPLVMALGVLIGAAPARAMCLGQPCATGPFVLGAPLVGAPSPFYYPSPSYPYPYPYAYSYFRPEAPYGWNARRNWRDTWQDDGVKVHAYTLR